MQFSDRNCKALNINIFLNNAHKHIGSGVKKIDESNRLQCNISSQFLINGFDVDFGDVVTPEAQEIDYPTLLDLPAPRIRAYPPETVVAEKLQAMVALGMQNSRMRDFYDLRIVARQFSFEGATLVAAVTATFNRRLTDIPQTVPTGLSDEFATDEHKDTQWKAFLARSQLEGAEMTLSQLIDELRIFLMPVLDAAASAKDFDQSWVSGGPWAANG